MKLENMSKFSYFKRVVNGEVVQLHFRENRGEYVIGKVYPVKDENIIFHDKEMEEVENVDMWLDCGIENKIFDCKPVPSER